MNKSITILMSNGITKDIKEIKVGDKVICADSQIGIVDGVNKIETDLYNIIPSKGNNYIVHSEQLLILKASNHEIINWTPKRNYYKVRWLQNFTIKEKCFSKSKYGSKENAYNSAKNYIENDVPKLQGYTKYKDIVEIKAKDYYNLPKRIRDAYKSFSVGINFESKQVEIDPYMLGYWLGDGTSANTEITTADTEIVEYVNNLAKSLGLQVTHSNKYHYNITTGTNYGGTGRNPWNNFLKKYNLINNKHIPDNFKFNSKENRLKLLAGLIDSDGYQRDNCYDFCLKSEKLSDDIIFLARSLGFFVPGKQKVKKTCTNSKNGPVTGDYFRFSIFGEGLENIPCLLNRKLTHERRTKKSANVNGVKIISMGKQPWYILKIKDNARYLLDDFTVLG